MPEKFKLIKLIALTAVIALTSCETLNLNKNDNDIDTEELPKWTISINEVVRYPRASAGEREIPTFSGQTIWVRKFYEFNSKVVENASVVPTDNPNEFNLRLKLNRQGSLVAMRLCNDKLHPPWGISIDGVYYTNIKVQKPSDTKPDDYSEIIVLGPFSKELAEAIAKYSEANYKHLNKDLK